ncbi:hypothetical protein C4577_04465 [Candidatus Parcubacteria bacterium]|nr:MAG: hypothetical protein C4577_04465 [Candidatus Parcubacteria bacterium]
MVKNQGNKKKQAIKQEGKAEIDKEKIKKQPEAESKDSPAEQGIYEFLKEGTKKKEESTEKFQSLVDNSKKILFKTKAVFPFDFFPDELTIDFNKVNLIIRDFFGSGRVHSVFIKDISDVFVYKTPFFSTIEIVDVGFVENSIKMKFLKNKDAMRARRIIQGLIITSKQDIDLAVLGLEIPDIIKKLEELGKMKGG